MKFNDLDLNNWKSCDINTDSLWLISSRDKSGKHRNIYHGNFIPQIPNQLIRRYTKKDDLIIDPFLGSGTTLYECEKLNRKCIGLDINESILEFVLDNFGINFDNKRYFLGNCDNTDAKKVDEFLENALNKLESKKAQFIFLHPPYMDIVKFSEKKEDLSQISDLKKFKDKFLFTCQNMLKYLEKNRYFALVIADLYRNSEIVPLGFELMNLIKQNFKVKLKGIIVKNIEGNRGKLGINAIWRYRALRSDYYIFKHEYIFVFKKEF
ncbi:DNA methyltransferase [Campylobacter coli]